MELPITVIYEDSFDSLDNQKCSEKIRILDVDGAYLVSIWLMETETKVLLKYTEVAFDSQWGAEEYLQDEHGIEFPTLEELQDDWRDDE